MLYVAVDCKRERRERRRFTMQDLRGSAESGSGTGQTATDLDNGSSRTRCPVSANRAFAIAGATGGTPGSPTPPGGAEHLGRHPVARDSGGAWSHLGPCRVWWCPAPVHRLGRRRLGPASLQDAAILCPFRPTLLLSQKHAPRPANVQKFPTISWDRRQAVNTLLVGFSCVP